MTLEFSQSISSKVQTLIGRDDPGSSTTTKEIQGIEDQSHCILGVVHPEAPIEIPDADSKSRCTLTTPSREVTSGATSYVKISSNPVSAVLGEQHDSDAMATTNSQQTSNSSIQSTSTSSLSGVSSRNPYSGNPRYAYVPLDPSLLEYNAYSPLLSRAALNLVEHYERHARVLAELRKRSSSPEAGIEPGVQLTRNESDGFLIKKRRVAKKPVMETENNLLDFNPINLEGGEKPKKCAKHYLVKWDTCPLKMATWQPIKTLVNYKAQVKMFKACSKIQIQRKHIPGDIDLNYSGQVAISEIKELQYMPHNIRRFVQLMSSNEGPPISVANQIDADGPPTNFECIPQNIYRSGVPEPSQATVDYTCDCKDNCTSQKCPCVSRNIDLPYNKEGFVQTQMGYPIFECSPYCGCPPKCYNRVVQKGRKVDVQVFKTLKKGWGIRAMQLIPKGSFITEYIGEVITDEEAEQRGMRCDLEGLNYLFDLDGISDSKYSIDGQFLGNFSHFFNHSCDPNLAVYTVFVDSHDESLHRLAFFAVRTISMHEELCINYFGNFATPSKINSDTSPPKKNYLACQCGSSKCTGFFFK